MLTDEEKRIIANKFFDDYSDDEVFGFAEAIERAVLAKAMPIPKQESFDGALWSNADQACVDYFSNVQPPKCSDVGMAVWKAGEALSKFRSASTGISEPVPAQAAAIPENKIPSLEQQLEFVTAERDGIRKHRDQLLDRINKAPYWVAIDDPADMPDDTAHVLWDGCDLSVDFTDTEVDFGTTFFSNGTEATHYLANLQPPLSASPKPE